MNRKWTDRKLKDRKKEGIAMAGSVLTGNESLIMEEFWKSGEPLTSVDLMERLQEKKWHASYLVGALRKLEEKGFIRICGTVRHSTQYARQFTAAVSREEFAAQLALTSGIGEKSIAEVTLAMVRGLSTDPEEIDSILNEASEELKKRRN